MGPSTYKFGMYQQTATEWEFPATAKTWKIIYNEQSFDIPACITVFTRNRNNHGPVQVALDVHFPDNMGRGGSNIRANPGFVSGTDHGDLHQWIEEPAEEAGNHTHDHFVIPDGIDHNIAIQTAVVTLVGINHIGSPAYDVIQHLQTAT